MTTGADLARQYVTERQGRHEFAQTSADSIGWTLHNFTAYAPDDPNDWTACHVEQWLAQLGHSRAATRSHLSRLRVFCRWLVVHQHLATNPTDGIRGPRVPRPLPRRFSRDEVARIVDACRDDRAVLMVLLMVQLGMRRAEVAGLELADVDLGANRLRVLGKGSKYRALPITHEVREAIDRYLMVHPASGGPLIRSYLDGRSPLTPPRVGKIVTNALRASGVKQGAWDGRSPHCLRHTAASDVLESGANVRQVQAMLGHESLQTTELYLPGYDVAALGVAMEGRTYASHADGTGVRSDP